jgi:acetyl esterase/lipase
MLPYLSFLFSFLFLFYFIFKRQTLVDKIWGVFLGKEICGALKTEFVQSNQLTIFITSSAKPNPVDRNLNWIWDIQTLPKIKMLIWRSSHDCLRTRNRIFAHAFSDLKISPKYVAQESTIHVLGDCIWAQRMIFLAY